MQVRLEYPRLASYLAPCKEGRKAGRAGRQEGRKAGRQEGRKAGMQEGKKAGRQEGRKAGRQGALRNVGT